MWLIGMMGSGKSTIGARVADTLGLEFLDTDRMVSDRAGKSIADIWGEVGESGFRRLESEAVAAVPAKECVIAAGGGAILDPRNRMIIAASPPVVWLRSRPRTLARRIDDPGGRPLLETEGTLEDQMDKILTERSDLYQELATHIVDTEDRTVAAVVEEVVTIWRG